MTTLTTDKHVANLSDALLCDMNGLRHYAVIVEQLPDLARFDHLRSYLPFYVRMCELCDAYDAAKGWGDFLYPETRQKENDLRHGFPTCSRCSGA